MEKNWSPEIRREGPASPLRGTPYGPWAEKNLYLLRRYAVAPDDDWKTGPGPAPAAPEVRAAKARIDKLEHANHFALPDAFVPAVRCLGTDGSRRFPILNYPKLETGQ